MTESTAPSEGSTSCSGRGFPNPGNGLITVRRHITTRPHFRSPPADLMRGRTSVPFVARSLSQTDSSVGISTDTYLRRQATVAARPALIRINSANVVGNTAWGCPAAAQTTSWAASAESTSVVRGRLAAALTGCRWGRLECFSNTCSEVVLGSRARFRPDSRGWVESAVFHSHVSHLPKKGSCRGAPICRAGPCRDRVAADP